MLERSVELQAEGVGVYPQVTCRPLNFEFQMAKPFIFESHDLFKSVVRADHEGKKAIFGDPELSRGVQAAEAASASAGTRP